jgi:hypothetical protein
MPSNTELAAKLGVKLTRISDKLLLDDLKSAKLTRQAIHREFIKRRPGFYSARWLAQRMGVSITTERRYNPEIGIHAQPMYRDYRIYWSNLGQIPREKDDWWWGVFLEDENGKRYPPKIGIARRLLAKKHSVTLRWQSTSYYWYGDTPPYACLRYGIRPNQAEIDAAEKKVRAYLREQKRKESRGTTTPTSPQGNKSSNPPPNPAEAEVTPKKPRYRRRFEDPQLEHRAMRVYETINAASGEKALSKIMARRLVGTYGIDRVEAAIRRMQQRDNITSPVGWLVTVLRSEAKEASRQRGLS